MGKWLRGDVVLQFLKGDRLAELKAPLSYDGGTLIWRTPAGLIFDGASIPRAFWWLVGSPFTGHYRRWAILHDAYYHKHQGRPRKRVDQQFKRGMKEDGVPAWKAELIYWAVRIFGRKAWNGA